MKYRCWRMRKMLLNSVLFCFLTVEGLTGSFAAVSYGQLSDQDLAPVFSLDQSITGAKRIRALGPVLEWQRAGDGPVLTGKHIGRALHSRYLGFRPFFSSVTRQGAKKRMLDILWPLMTGLKNGTESKWRLATVIAHNFDTTDTESKYTFMAFPVIFAGRSQSNEPYFALFPAGGKIHDVMAQDTIAFVLFPLYLYLKQDETESHNFLWPLISRRKGGGTDALRVFPFYMHSEKEDRWEKTSVLWPFWNSVRYKYENEKGGGFILFPLFGRVATERQTTTWVVPPFFKWAVSDVGTHAHLPWPFIQYASGDTEKLYFWPLWGSKKTGGTDSCFALWPIIHCRSSRLANEVSRSFRVLPVFYYEDRGVKTEHGGAGAAGGEKMKTQSRYIKIWPLGFYRRNGEQHLLRILSLWPLKQSPPIERNLAPLWSLFTSSRVGTRREDELLWGLVSREREGDHYKKWSWLMGLVQYKRESGQKQLRLLHFIKFGGK